MLSPARGNLTRIRRDLRRVLRQPCAASVRRRALGLLASIDARLVALKRDSSRFHAVQPFCSPVHVRPSEPAAAFPMEASACARLDLLPFELLELLFSRFLRPFPDWISCRLVQSTLAAVVRALDAGPSLWVGPVVPLQLTPAFAGRSRARLLEELSLCKCYAPEARPPSRFDEGEDEGDNDQTIDWTRTGVTNLGAPGQASGDPRIIWRPPVEGVSPPPKVMTEEEAHRLAEAEGISLVLAPCNASGYKGVSRNNKTTCSGYCAQFCQYGRILRLGSFSGAPEAALAYARHVKAVTAMMR